MDSAENSRIPATTLLYVEDDVATQKGIIQILTLTFPRISLLLAQNGRDGFDLYSRNRPDIVVTDVRMPIINGIQMAKQIRELDRDAQIIILSAADETSHILEAIDIGITNYVLKPVIVDKFIAAIERCLENLALREQLAQKEEYIRQIAYYDYLTGLPNRQLSSELFHKSIAHAQRHQRFLSILYLDLDGFKNINDTLGHTVGDQLLKSVAERLKICCGREQDTVARWGGDEFVILLTDIDGPQEAVGVARKINDAFAHPITLPNHELTISLSIGISIFPENGTDEVSLIKNADLAMYCAKNKGRNQFHRSGDSGQQHIPAGNHPVPSEVHG